MKKLINFEPILFHPFTFFFQASNMFLAFRSVKYVTFDLCEKYVNNFINYLIFSVIH